MSYGEEAISETPEEIAEYEAMYKRLRDKEKEKKDNRKPLSERLPEHVFERIHQDIGQASMCWELPENTGVFHAKKAAEIAFELCHFIAGILDSKQGTKDKLIEFENKCSVLPERISKTGSPDEPLTEIIICTAISGGADYMNEMPKRLILRRKLANGKEYVAVYLQEAE